MNSPSIDHMPDGAVAAVERSPDDSRVFVHDLVFDRYDCPPELKTLVPDIDPKYTYDATSMRVLYDIATAERHDMPWLLDGEPGTSKTSSIHHFYALLGRPVKRINCRGQTDTMDLIGRFQPSEPNLQEQCTALLKRCAEPAYLDRLVPAARQILEDSQTRVLSVEEMKQLMELCGIETGQSEWRWQYGAVPYCMLNGIVLILDEADLARQEVLQGATNSVLEDDRMLTIPEHNGETIRRLQPGDEHEDALVSPLHPQFRIFATRNPMDSSRIPFGTPYKDRWLGRTVVDVPDQDSLQERLSRRIFGTQPAIFFRGSQYEAHSHPLPPRRDYANVPSGEHQENANLRDIPNIAYFLELLAEFHEHAAEAAHERDIGASGLDATEGLIFTQRTLGAFMAFLEQRRRYDRWQQQAFSTQDDPTTSILTAFETFYLNRCADPDDQQKLVDVLTAMGISLENWCLTFTEGQRHERVRDAARLLRYVTDYLQVRATPGTMVTNGWEVVPSTDERFVDMRLPGANSLLPERFFDAQVPAKRIGNTMEISFHDGTSVMEPGTATSISKMQKQFVQTPVRSLLVDVEGGGLEWYLEDLTKQPTSPVVF